MEGEAAAAAAAEIRVVRCPKCDKFLPELPNYSVYVCGGCGATLQAKKNSRSNTASKKSDGESVEYLEVLESVTEKKGAAFEAMFRTTEDVEATTDERLVHSRLAAMQSNSGYRRDDNLYPREPSALNLKTPLRCDGREIQEAKYRRIRNEEKEETKQPLRVRDRSPRSPIEGISPNAYPGEGLSDYHLKSTYRHLDGEDTRGRNLDGPSRVRGLEKDRAELLRMLDELRDQVQRSCEVTNKPSRSAPTNRAVDASSSYSSHERLSRLRHGSPQLHRNGSQHSTSLNAQSPGVPHSYAPVPAQQDLHGYGEPVPHTRAPSYPAGMYPWRNFDNYFFGQCDPDPLISYHHEGFYHQPACSCLHCCHGEFLPVQGAPLSFNHRRAPYLVNGHGTNPVDGPLVFGMPSCNSRGINTSLQRNDPRATLRKKPVQTSEPIAGGAPFTICYNCYEVLQLPKQHLLFGKNEYKLRCGSCSHAIVVKFDGSRLNVSAPVPIANISAGSRNSSNSSPGSHDHTTSDERPYSFSAGSHDTRDKDLPSNLSESEKMQASSSLSSFSDNEQSAAQTNSQKDTSQARDLPPEADMFFHIPSLPLRDHLGCSPSDKVVNGSGKGSISTRSEHEKVVLTESFKQNSVKDVPVANEMDLSDDEYENAGYAQDSFDVPQDIDHPRATKTGDSFFTNLIKKSFKINNGMSKGRARVSINGYRISNRAVRKAEKLAGPIYPGEYWYDYRAGFWGAMGHSCLGMIPPYIPEFNFPMPKNCAGGNTGVVVNGRELHQKDLDLLVARGLPDSPGRSYRIEISGKISDETSGEELYGLGKLAPTVEKMKCGFGMRVPRVIQ